MPTNEVLYVEKEVEEIPEGVKRTAALAIAGAVAARYPFFESHGGQWQDALAETRFHLEQLGLLEVSDGEA